MSSDEDSFFDTPETNRRSRWVLAGFAVVTLLAVGLPLIWALTGWL
jgi:hypothetical protein